MRDEKEGERRREGRREGGWEREREREREYSAQRMKYWKNRIETWSRTLRALSTSRLSSPYRHLHDVMWGNSWSLFSYLVFAVWPLLHFARGETSLTCLAISPFSCLISFPSFASISRYTYRATWNYFPIFFNV